MGVETGSSRSAFMFSRRSLRTNDGSEPGRVWGLDKWSESGVERSESTSAPSSPELPGDVSL
jgi:hypothetical protein